MISDLSKNAHPTSKYQELRSDLSVRHVYLSTVTNDVPHHRVLRPTRFAPSAYSSIPLRSMSHQLCLCLHQYINTSVAQTSHYPSYIINGTFGHFLSISTHSRPIKTTQSDAALLIVPAPKKEGPALSPMKSAASCMWL